jgi:hypothetical protein
MLREELTGPIPRGLLLPIVPLLISPFWFLLGMYWQNFNLIAIFLLWWLIALRTELLRRRGTAPVPQNAVPLA